MTGSSAGEEESRAQDDTPVPGASSTQVIEIDEASEPDETTKQDSLWFEDHYPDGFGIYNIIFPFFVCCLMYIPCMYLSFVLLSEWEHLLRSGSKGVIYPERDDTSNFFGMNSE